jgi:hypothetical protein
MNNTINSTSRDINPNPNNTTSPFDTLNTLTTNIEKPKTNNKNKLHTPIPSNFNNPNLHNNKNTHTWKIITHNIQGFNDPTKRTIWNNYCSKNNIDIAIITETQINKLTNTQYWKFKEYDTFWNNNSKGSGILLMIKKNIGRHISKTHTFPGRGICIDLNFTNNIRICIIAIYYPATSGPERKELTQWLTNLIQEANHKN